MVIEASTTSRDLSQWGEILSPVISALAVLGGVWLGHFLSSSRKKEELVFSEKVDAISDFLKHANDSLQYLVAWEDPREAGPAKLQLTVLGSRAALFVDEEAAELIDQYTTDYAMALQERIDAEEGDPEARGHVFGDIEQELEELTLSLREEIHS